MKNEEVKNTKKKNLKTKTKKKHKIKQPEFVVGKHIRDIKINDRQHFLLFAVMLVLFNLILMASIGFVLVYLNMWYNWVLCFVLLALSVAFSFKTYVSIKNFHKCELYDNALAVKSIWFNIIIPFKDIYEIILKTSWLDKAFHLNTKSLEVKILNHKRKNFTIHFIEEDANQLRFEIFKMMENNANNKEEAESLIAKKLKKGKKKTSR